MPRLHAQRCKQARRRPTVKRHQPDALAAVGHPLAFVRVIADQVVNFLHLVQVDHMFHQVGCQHGAGRQVLEPLVVSQFVDRRASVRDDPQLGRYRLPVQPDQAQPEPAQLGAGAGQAVHEAGDRLGVLPAVGVDLFIRRYGTVHIGGLGDHLDNRLPLRQALAHAL